MKKRTSLSVLTLVAALSSGTVPGQAPDPRELINEARTVARLIGDDVWPGFSAAPFGILLVEEDQERLFCHQSPTDDFESIGIDPVLSCPAATRPVVFSPGMLASFPAVGRIPTIVAGTPEATGLSQDAWVLTLLHEHFHQMQFAWPGYRPGAGNLGLAGDDETGMWMLNYPFPYDQDETAAAFAVMAELLNSALNARGTGAFHSSVEKYWQAREVARHSVSRDDWKYIEFQLWQEGVARWTEGALAALSAGYSHMASEATARVLQELDEFDIAGKGRSSLYAIGAAEAMLLEAGESGWREKYWTEAFSLGPQLRRMIASRTHDNH